MVPRDLWPRAQRKVGGVLGAFFLNMSGLVFTHANFKIRGEANMELFVLLPNARSQSIAHGFCTFLRGDAHALLEIDC